jgi:glycosidase
MTLGISLARQPRAEHLTLYEIFARVWLEELSRKRATRITFDTVPEEELERLSGLGFDALWLMGVWEGGPIGRDLARTHPDLARELEAALPGFATNDVYGSPYAVARYAVDPSYGGDAGLSALRRRLEKRGLGLVLDFVPNHLARDHHWISERPNIWVREPDGKVACGRDPYFPPWTDTAQVDYRLRGARDAMIEALRTVAQHADGVRCDMSMLLLEEIFARTWSKHPPKAGLELARGEFWAEAIDALRAGKPSFVFIAEAYWDLEYRLQTLGFDFTYDKTLYDRLLHGTPASIRAHLLATPDIQRRSVRFLENHDEPRIASLLERERLKAATALTMTVPGLRFFHDGQLEGRKVRTPIQLARRREEVADPELVSFHRALLDFLRRPALRVGSFRTLAPRSVWEGNATHDNLVAHRWEHPDGSALVVVNLGASPSQCKLTVDLAGIGGRSVTLKDPIHGASFTRDGDEMLDPERGLYVDLPAFGFHAFLVECHA